MVLPDGGARVVLSRSVVFDERVVVQRILGICSRNKDGSNSAGRDEDVSTSIRYKNETTETGFSFQNRDAQLPAVAPQKHNGSIRELLVSAKARVNNVTGTPSSAADIAQQTYGVSPRKINEQKLNQEDQRITRQQAKSLQLLAQSDKNKFQL